MLGIMIFFDFSTTKKTRPLLFKMDGTSSILRPGKTSDKISTALGRSSMYQILNFVANSMGPYSVTFGFKSSIITYLITLHPTLYSTVRLFSI